LKEQTALRPYGIDIVWGEELEAKSGEVVLCSVDEIASALACVLD
jgi:hypothetical protein